MDKKYRILILDGNIPSAFQNVYVEKIYKKVNSFMRLIKRIHYHSIISHKEIWYDNWKQSINEFDVFIIFDGILGNDIIKYIKKKNINARIIVYYVNKVIEGARNHPETLRDVSCELWSFDKNDCEKFSMNFSHYFYDKYVSTKSECDIIYDAFFIGVDKNRLEKLIELKFLLDQCGLKNKFLIVKDKNKCYSDKDKFYLTEGHLAYEDIIHLINQSKCIVEIVQDGQVGLTLRPMEAIYYSKKLITNNKDIINYDFYSKDNIFILGIDSITDIKDFFKKEYSPIKEQIIKEYTYESWLERFFR